MEHWSKGIRLSFSVSIHFDLNTDYFKVLSVAHAQVLEFRYMLLSFGSGI